MFPVQYMYRYFMCMGVNIMTFLRVPNAFHFKQARVPPIFIWAIVVFPIYLYTTVFSGAVNCENSSRKLIICKIAYPLKEETPQILTIKKKNCFHFHCIAYFMSFLTQNVKKLLFSRRKEGKPLKVGNIKYPISPKKAR